MKIASVEFFPLSIPYRHTEVSSRVARRGVSDVILRMTTDEGLVGWGECCAGADTVSIEGAARAMLPLIIGRDPRDSELIRRDVFKLGLWDYRLHTGNFAYAGFDMAMLDIASQACGLPLWRFLGGRGAEGPVSYFCYLARGSDEALAAQCDEAVRGGYQHYYLKVGLSDAEDERMLRTVRNAIGPDAKLRIDANEAWSEPHAISLMRKWNAAYDVDFVEAPVRAHPIRLMAEFRRRIDVPLCANEGLDGESNVMEMIHHRAADVLCFSSYWVGSLRTFLNLARTASSTGISVCKHSHGEFGIAAAAHQHALLTIANGVGGHQQTASVMADCILREPLPIAHSPHWEAREDPGLGVSVDLEKLDFYHRAYLRDGQFMPWAGI
ncbi:mandelate racemase/muconate lactonizing enzyme family protein [Aestuariivirga sp.]|uniref:mandelate racemase/muconate lactonizing enzyme family protein n=1 Tax=Aestuariivirga sp. TaxID=2650926 RepID=UPI003BAAD085